MTTLCAIAGLFAVAFVLSALFLAFILWMADRQPHGDAEFWMQQATEKDLELQRARVELAIQSEMAAKARHALQRYTALCAERHVPKK